MERVASTGCTMGLMRRSWPPGIIVVGHGLKVDGRGVQARNDFIFPQ
jgi:hypothetical protein